VRARLGARAHARGRRLAVEAHAVEVALRGVRGRGEVIEVALRLGHTAARHHVARARRQQRGPAAAARDHVRVPPAVLLAEQHEGAPAADPLEPGVGRVARVHPGRVRLLVECRDAAFGAEPEEQEGPRVAAAREALDQHLVGSREADSAQVEALRRHRNRQPARVAALDAHDTDAELRDRRAHARVAPEAHLWIGGVALVGRPSHRAHAAHRVLAALVDGAEPLAHALDERGAGIARRGRGWGGRGLGRGGRHQRGGGKGREHRETSSPAARSHRTPPFRAASSCSTTR
jgi:hypothetical protein